LEGNDLRLTDDTVSRNHAEVVRTAEGLVLRDLGSTNGTYVGPVRIKEVYLGDQRTFRVGRTDVEFTPIDEVFDIVPAAETQFAGLVGQSVVMRELFSVLVSRAIHERSRRRSGPFVVFDCGAVPGTLIESELFGHERGAFTGAVAPRAGMFEQADGGTIFIDELGELPLELQPALLRVLEQREVRRVGDRRVRPVNVRVVAATNRDLQALVAEGRFRQDLYYRLAVVEIAVPPLRDRKEDLDLLVRHALGTAGFPHAVRGLSEGVRPIFEAWDWPGNVRELRNVVLRALPFCDGTEIGLDALPDALRSATSARDDVAAGRGAEVSFREAKDRMLEDFERSYLEDLVERAGKSLSRASRIAGVDRKTIARMLKRHGIRGVV
jgi:DNA-binding NtrC family response regulator